MTTTTNLRKTKIVATLGLNSSDPDVLRDMITAGMNVARINFSHGDHTSNGKLFAAVRSAANKVKQPVAILQDLCGPKIRIGDFSSETVTLVPGQTFTLTTSRVTGTASKVSVNYKKLPREVQKGASILLNDGKLHLTVKKTTETDIVCTVVIGGTIRGRRGVNVPGAMLSINAITAKDKKDLAFGLANGVNFVTLSFVRQAKEVHQLRTLLGDKHPDVHIIAKIETNEALHNLNEIIEAADGIMVARGDLAIEIPREEVPLVQKDIIARCNTVGKPVITATQMLDSMREQEAPTRAEVNDVANAIIDGTDAVMLSDETTVGKFPVAAIEAMDNIARVVETNMYAVPTEDHDEPPHMHIASSITEAIAREAAQLDVAGIVALSESGRTAQLIAKHRPRQPILVLTPHNHTVYHSLLVHGCHPIKIRPITHLHGALQHARKELRRMHVAEPGELFILGAGMPFRTQGSTNMLIVETV